MGSSLQSLKTSSLPRSGGRRWRLLFVHFGEHQMRGSERCLLNLIKAVDANKFEIIVWSNHPALNDLARPFAKVVLHTHFYAPFGFSASSRLGGAVKDLLAYIKEAGEVIRTHQPDLILCNSLAPSQWIVPASLLSGLPVIVYLHTNYLPKSRLLSMCYGASHLVGVSQFTLENFRRDGVNARFASVVYNGVEDLSLEQVNRTQLRQALEIGQDDIVFVSLCALVEWKRVDIIIEAFRLMSAGSQTLTTLLIVGEGPCLDSLRAQAKGLRVVFGGWRSDIANVLAASDCLVVAAEREAFALTIMEAGSVCCPVIGARSGGVKELIFDGDNGLLADPGNPASFSAAMTQMRDDTNLRKRLGGRARDVFLEKYQVKRMTDEMYGLIGRLSDRSSSALSSTLHRIFRLVYFCLKVAVKRLMSGK